ncbi:ribonuclease HI [Halomonas halocynthiae]|uniref:ribonuclease HI n=1 Tax=Halomonas halocynthiae TaxID=176290 RepID=UPI0004190D9F|nr:ribonuclease HI [Halomonas halocynthiae]
MGVNATDSLQSEQLSEVTIYTDGGCRGNPGPGGWGVWLCWGDHEKSLKGGEHNTTNNRMELMAAIQALRALKRPCKVELWTDSEYVRKGITEWIHGWIKRGWKTAAKAPVKNADLWQSLLEETQRHEVEWHWVKGHSGVAGNEKADSLANEAIDELR